MMFLLAGLGNPGDQYANTRHNAGALLLASVIEAYNLSFLGKKFNAHAFKGRIGHHDIVTVFPQTYMNRSGISVQAAADFYQIPPERIIVFYDDLDLAPAAFRIRQGGGNGGHNGLKDIDRLIGTNYWRVRLGIGRPEHKTQVTSYVLGEFSKEEHQQLQPLFNALTTHLPILLDGGADTFSNAVALERQQRQKIV